MLSSLDINHIAGLINYRLDFSNLFCFISIFAAKFKNMYMNKISRIVFAVAFLCGACVLTSCDKDDEKSADEQLTEKILGKWILSESSGAKVATDLKMVTTFKKTASGLKAYASVSSFVMPTTGQQADADDNQWKHMSEDDVTIENGKLTIISKDSVMSRKIEHYVLEGDAKSLKVFTTTSVSVGGAEYSGMMEHSEVWTKVNVDYSDDILGLWEGSASTESKYDDGDVHRWRYLPDGTYVYYLRNEQGEWVPSESVFSTYFVDGNLLCTRWKNVGENEKENREWWEIESIDGNEMKWTALRREFTGMQVKEYTASFSMRKVKE